MQRRTLSHRERRDDARGSPFHAQVRAGGGVVDCDRHLLEWLRRLACFHRRTADFELRVVGNAPLIRLLEPAEDQLPFGARLRVDCVGARCEADRTELEWLVGRDDRRLIGARALWTAGRHHLRFFTTFQIGTAVLN